MTPVAHCGHRRRSTPLAALWLIVTASFASAAGAAVFQYAVPVTTEKGQSTAFLWIPPEAQQVRGVVLAGMTLMEREFVKDERIRRVCADQQLAIVFLKCGLLAVDVQKVLDDLAKVSGYGEIAFAPLMLVGHSAGGPQAKALAVRMADRCFGLVQYRGGLPGDSQAVPPGLPVLVMLGQFDEFAGTMRTDDGRESWHGAIDSLAAYRAADPANLASVVIEPGAGHFAWSDRNAAYLATYLRKAAAARIPARWSAEAGRPPALTQIDYRTGWLTDLAIGDRGRPPAPWTEYPADRTRTAWHFDKELAQATLAYHEGLTGKKDQFIRWTDPCWVDAGARFFFTSLRWVDDGQTFEVHPVYSDTYPGQYDGRGPRWPLAGKPVGHSSAPILVKHVGGPIVVTGPNRLRIRHDNLAPATEASRATFMAFSEGDAEYRYTEQVGMMPRGFVGLKQGATQTIDFPPVGNLKMGGPPVELKATSTAGLPVEYYVAWGPARVEGTRLQVCEVPVRARFPIAVKVVAWQFGRAIEPMVQTAAPVEQTIQIEKP